jgi:phenylalanyl-tRNA synthetase beta chain
MAEIAGGTILKGRVDTRAVPPEDHDPAIPIEINLRPDRVSALLGVSVTHDEMSGILKNLGFALYPEPNGQIRVRVPSHRNDVSREIDLIEEIARLLGYNRIPSTLARGRTRPGRPDPKNYFEGRIREILTACGYSEANSCCFEGDSTFEKLGFPKDDGLRNMIRIMNPISGEENGLRTTLLPSLIRNLSLNARRGNAEAALFEVARIYLPAQPDITQGEVRVLAFGAYGPTPKPWDGEERERDFFDARGVVEEIFRRIGMEETVTEPVSLPFLHPGRAAEIRLGERRVGIVGELSPAARKEYDLRGRVILGELDLDELIKEARFWPESFQAYSAYPPVARDLALVADKSVESSAIERVIREQSKGLLESIALFDLYQGEHLPKGKRSLAFRMIYRSPSGTLIDEKVNQLQDRIVKRLKQDLNVTLRE